MAQVVPGFLVIRMHKCGCSYSQRVLEATFPGQSRFVDPHTQHLPVSEVPEEQMAGRKIIGLVRNPFAWYVSRWNYWCKEGYWKEEAGLKEAPSFGDWLTANILNPFGSAGKSMQGYPKPLAKVGAFTYQHIAYHHPEPTPLLRDGTFDDLFVMLRDGELRADDMMKTECLGDEMVRVFGERVRPHLDQWRNSYPCGEPHEHYSPALRRLVEDSDFLVLDQYGYSFGK
jgi:hypothetical protein